MVGGEVCISRHIKCDGVITEQKIKTDGVFLRRSVQQDSTQLFHTDMHAGTDRRDEIFGICFLFIPVGIRLTGRHGHVVSKSDLT